MTQMSERTTRIVRYAKQADPSATPEQIIAGIKLDGPGTGVPSRELTVENVKAALRAQG